MRRSSRFVLERNQKVKFLDGLDGLVVPKGSWGIGKIVKQAFPSFSGRLFSAATIDANRWLC